VDDVTGLVTEIRAFRPFLPAKEFETSLRFYRAIGFHAYPLGESLAELALGLTPSCFKVATSRNGLKIL
jgi:hypothetical protein